MANSLNTSPVSRSDYVVSLARELLEDIELSRLPAESLLLKAMRLARIVDADEWSRWMNYELTGYLNNPEATRWMAGVGRSSGNQIYWVPLSQIDTELETARARLQLMRIPDINVSVSSANPNDFVGGQRANSAGAAIASLVFRSEELGKDISARSRIRGSVMAWLHNFALLIYHQRAFSSLAQSIFERFQLRVDALLADRSSDVLQKIPAISDRLAEGDREGVSQALNSCRRIIDDFANAVQPPTDGTLEIDGEPFQAGPRMTKDRLRAYIKAHCSSKSREDKLRHTLSDLYDRVSTGVHDDVTLAEARAVFLETYCLLGEILELADPPAAAAGPSSQPEGGL